MSENKSELAVSPRPLDRAELDGYRQEFDRLASQFDESAATLRQQPENPLAIPELRSAMSRAGHELTRLIFHGAIAAPPRLPPWLSWRTHGHARPRFVGLLGRPFVASWSPRSTVLGLVWHMRPGPQVVDRSTPRRPNEDSGAVFIRRHTWIESVAGWLGQRCTPRANVNVPTVTVLTVTGSGNASSPDRVDIVHDWIEDRTQQRLLLLDLARDSAAACRHLAAELGKRATGHHATPWPNPLSTFDALDDLRAGISHGSGAAGHEAFDILFGVRDLHDELVALGDRRDEFKNRFAGTREARSIADFAVTSGHEAVAFIADRLAKAAGVRRNTIPLCRRAVEDPRVDGDGARVEKCQSDLELAGRDFAKALERAFCGWDEHRAWIRRSIEDEAVAWQERAPTRLSLGKSGGVVADAEHAKIEKLRRAHKQKAVAEAGDDVGKLLSLWQETIDLIFRTNISDDTRVEELAHLRSVTAALSAAAFKRKMARAALQALSGRLQTLMPREWFPDLHARELLRKEVSAANVEVDDLYHTWREERAAADAPNSEAAQAGSTDQARPSIPSPEQHAVTLKFARPPEAKQKCLEALAAAPHGIPRHEDIAVATKLEHQTVKEAMTVLKKAGFVEKPTGAWLITDSGLRHLKLLRGE